MFDTLINLFESCLLIAFVYRISDEEKRKHAIAISICAVLGQFAFIQTINRFSPSEGFLDLLEVALFYLYLSLVSDMKPCRKLFTAQLPFTIISISNMFLLSTWSRILYNTIDYSVLVEKQHIPVFLAAQIIHLLLFALIVHAHAHDKEPLDESSSLIAFFSLLVLNTITTSFESIMLGSDKNGWNLQAGILGMLALAVILYLFFQRYLQQIRHNAEQEKEITILKGEADSNQKIMTAQKELYEIRHDMKHFINALSTGNVSPDLQHIMDKYRKYESPDSIPIETSYLPLNYVLNLRRDEAVSKNIDFISKINFISHPEIEDADFLLLFSNLLDNAIEHIGMAKKILVEVQEIQDRFVIQVSNSIDEPVLNLQNRFPAADGNEHGHGIHTIQVILQKCHGSIYYKEEQQMLVATVILPVKSGS